MKNGKVNTKTTSNIIVYENTHTSSSGIGLEGIGELGDSSATSLALSLERLFSPLS